MIFLQDNSGSSSPDSSQPKQLSAEIITSHLPSPHELFSESQRPSEFEQPILSAKVVLPKAIFADDSEDSD